MNEHAFGIAIADSNRPLIDDGRIDVQTYNDELEALNSPTWFDVPWLFVECYMYRYDLSGIPRTFPTQGPDPSL